MHSRSEAEETAFSGVGGEGGHCQGFQRLWEPPGDGDLLQIPRAVYLGKRRPLAGGSDNLGPGEDGVEKDVADTQQGEIDTLGFRLLF